MMSDAAIDSLALSCQGIGLDVFGEGPQKCHYRGISWKGRVDWPEPLHLVRVRIGAVAVGPGCPEHDVEEASHEPHLRAAENRQYIRRIREHQQGR